MFGSDNWFGSTNILLLGDLLQLLPVNGSHVFERLNAKAVLYKLGCMISVNIWKDAVVYDKLTINQRQKSDPQFLFMLDEIRRGCPSQSTIDMLKERIILSLQAKTHSHIFGKSAALLYAFFPPENRVKTLTVKCRMT